MKQLAFIFLLILASSCSTYKGQFDFIEKEYKYYWFSPGQYEVVSKIESGGFMLTFGGSSKTMYVNGKVYSEMSSRPVPAGKWPDYVLVTKGRNKKIRIN